MANETDKDKAPVTANAGGASSTPSPANTPGPDPTVAGSNTATDGNPGAAPKQENKEQKTSTPPKEDKKLSAKERELEEREKALDEREAALASGVAQPGSGNAEMARQNRESAKILNGPTEKITLQYQHTNITGAGAVSYGPGEVEVPKPFAEDLLRRDAEHNDYQVGLHQRRENLMFSGVLSGAGK